MGLPSVVLQCQTGHNGFPEPVRNRLEAFVESVRDRRTGRASR